MTQPVAVTAIVAWIWAGMFAQLLQDGGFVGGLVWLADSAGVGAALFPAITFVLAAVFTTGIGTGYGATVAFVGLFFPAGVLLGANPVLLFGAILSGAIFGDNLAPVSDTTIVSAVTQDADIGGVVASRFKYIIIAATVAFLGYVVVAGGAMDGRDIGAEAQTIFLEGSEAIGLIHVVSMLAVIVAAIAGRHIVEAISWGSSSQSRSTSFSASRGSAVSSCSTRRRTRRWPNRYRVCRSSRSSRIPTRSASAGA